MASNCRLFGILPFWLIAIAVFKEVSGALVREVTLLLVGAIIPELFCPTSAWASWSLPLTTEAPMSHCLLWLKALPVHRYLM